jgi:partner of Y14 and mago
MWKRVRKELKIRPGFTPQEDVSRFRGSRQAQMDRNALPKGHIIGWTPPSASSPPVKTGMSKSAKKNEKRKEKRKEATQKKIAESWEDEDEDEPPAPRADAENKTSSVENAKETVVRNNDGETETLVEKMEKLDV